MSDETKIFDLVELRKLLDDEEWQLVESDREERRVFIGTVFSLVPSGKYYQPWACSNVTEEEADQDSDWYERAEAELEIIGCYLASGEGDPCDLFAGEIRDVEDDEEDDDE